MEKEEHPFATSRLTESERDRCRKGNTAGDMREKNVEKIDSSQKKKERKDDPSLLTSGSLLLEFHHETKKEEARHEYVAKERKGAKQNEVRAT